MKTNKGFTIIEMLVVITVVSVMIAATVVGLGKIRGQANDRVKVADIKSLRESFEVYFNRYSSYPATVTPGQPLVGPDGRTVLKKVPSTFAQASATCTGSYGYTQVNNGGSYSLSYCLNGPVDSLVAGNYTANPNSISGCSSSCVGKNCGDDGCGGSCGTCVLPQTCAGGGEAGVCGCTASCTGKCQGESDGCGGTCTDSCTGNNPIDVCSAGSCVADTSTKLMLHMNGADNGTTFTDNSSGAKSVTVTNALTKTATKKFGTAGGYFDGTGDYLTLAHHADWDIGSGDYTIDFWVKMPVTAAANQEIVSHHTQSGSSLGTYNGWGIITQGGNSRVSLFVNNGDGVGTLKVNCITPIDTPIDDDTWHHVAFSKSGSNYYAFIDGVLGNTCSYATAVPNPTTSLYIGKAIYYADYNGYIDDLRISKGIARWTTTFTPPTREY